MRSFILGGALASLYASAVMAADAGGSATGGTNDGPSDDAGSPAEQEGKMGLADALASLDPTNNEHWTKTGLPAMSVLEELTGGSLTREDVNAASSGFNRDNARDPGSNASEHITAAAKQVDGADIEGESAGSIEAREAMDGAVDGPDGTDAIALFEAAVAAAQTDRFRMNPELQAMVRMWQTQQRGVRAHQDRLDARSQRRADRNSDNGEAKAGTPDAVAA